TADMDGDGDLDVVMSNYGSGIYWYENPSDLDAGSWAAHRLGEGYGHDLEVGDVDADGDLDVVTCDKKRVVLWVNENSTNWEPVVVHDEAGEGTALEDIDGDGDLDILFHGLWLENPGEVRGAGEWPAHTVAPGWHNEARVAVGDMDGDGRRDVVLSVSESEGQIAWFAPPADPAEGEWTRHDIEPGRTTGVHGLQVADFDDDGDLDVAAAEMHTSPKRRVTIYLNDEGQWRGLVLSKDGSHNIRAADIGSDGDIDIVGKNYGGTDRVIELWENLTAPGEWEYFAADEKRPKSDRWKMGLVYADVDGDGFDDIVAGSCVYHNPAGGGPIKGPWDRTRLDDDMDVFFATDVDGDDLCDLVGMSGTGLVWLESVDRQGTGWTGHRVAEVPDERTQGYVTAQIRPGGRPELVFTRGKALFYAVIPADDPSGPWELVNIGRSEEEGVAAGDIDGDGDLDVAAVAADGHHPVWFENPGEPRGGWSGHEVGESKEWLDRVALADVDGDGRLDLIVTEETRDRQYNARIYWFHSPQEPAEGPWSRHTVALLRSVNSMDVADLDGDGDVDIVAAEHTDQGDEPPAPDNLTAWFENPGGDGRWIIHPIDVSNRSSHLGTRLRDLDGDGDLDLASIAWRQYRYLHVWLNYMDE
ncbi:MAG: VCBS repeat-containing protein, partial [Candidatus Latescibacterota bacterium]